MINVDYIQIKNSFINENFQDNKKANRKIIFVTSSLAMDYIKNYKSIRIFNQKKKDQNT